MKEAKIFQNGRSQAVRLPKEYRFDTDKIYIKKIDNIIMLIPKENQWESFINSLDKFTDDFMEDRIQLKSEERDKFK